ncbi:MAG: peptidoglycan endopeptidase, partial [Pacificimonas sp.]
GLVWWALGAPVPGPAANYSLHGDLHERLVEGLVRFGLERVADARTGDVLLLTVGPGQAHLAIESGRMRGRTQIVHAHFGLRQVVEGPLPASWAVRSRWRTRGD